MIEFKAGKCPKCGRLAEIVPSNNPISPGICGKCLAKELDASNLKQADFFCRTYNVPFQPDKWLELYKKCGDEVFVQYARWYYATDGETLYSGKSTRDKWGELEEEWERCTTFEALLAKIEPIKTSFIARNQIKWGNNFSFEEYVQLENLLVSTLRANDITNPLQIDAIKKACKISVELDRAIMKGDPRLIKDLSSAYSNFTKTAQIDDVIAAANSDVITTVADLAEEIERCGGQYKYYDRVDRDIVDKTITDIKNYIRTLVQDSTGLGTTLENIAQAYRASVEEQAAANASAEVSIEDLVADTAAAANHALDAQLATETLDDVDLGEDDDDGYF